MKLLAIVWLLLGCAVARAEEKPATPRVPVVDGAWWRICEMPDLGELNGPDPKKQHIVDHSFIQAANGKWQLWACMRGVKVGRLLHGWEGDSLEQGPWKPKGVMARARAEFGEKTESQEAIQAPHFVKAGDVFHCFYNSAGIRLMTSRDGVHYERSRQYDGGNLLYADGGRDVMVLKIGDLYHAYSTVSTTDGRGYIILKASPDLKQWSKSKIVCEGGKAGSGPVSAESPFVVQLDGFFYLFRASSVDGKTYVYRSSTPDAFCLNDDSKLVAELKVKAPEIILHDGQWFISDLADFQGIKLARLKWEEGR